MNEQELTDAVQQLQAQVADLEARLEEAMVVDRAVNAPTASEVTRGRLFLTEGASGAADTVKVILKSAADTYSAKTVATG